MRPTRTADWMGAEPLVEVGYNITDRRGRRSPKVLLELDERDRYLIEASAFFPRRVSKKPDDPGLSDREVARQLRSRLMIYREGRWRRDRAEALCPPRHAGRLEAVLWAILKVADRVPSERLIRVVLAGST